MQRVALAADRKFENTAGRDSIEKRPRYRHAVVVRGQDEEIFLGWPLSIFLIIREKVGRAE